MVNRIMKAAEFAEEEHRSQKRRYTGQPYIYHPARVAARVTLLPNCTEDMIVAAWLHDVLEDTNVHAQVLKREFGQGASSLVEQLTNPPKGSKLPRAERKSLDRGHAEDITEDAKLIKFLDRIDNLNDMRGHKDNGFAELYAGESLQLCHALARNLPMTRTVVGLIMELTTAAALLANEVGE